MQTPNGNTTVARKIFSEMENLVLALYSRWLDEQEYEDITEYGALMSQKIAPYGATFGKMYGRPFGFTFQAEGKTYRIGVNSKQYYYKVIG